MPLDPSDESTITRVTAAAVAGVLRELGYGRPAEREPAYMTDPEIREHLLACAKDTFRRISREPGFPPAIMRGNTRLREVAAVRRWLAARQVS